MINLRRLIVNINIMKHSHPDIQHFSVGIKMDFLEYHGTFFVRVSPGTSSLKMRQ